MREKVLALMQQQGGEGGVLLDDGDIGGDGAVGGAREGVHYLWVEGESFGAFAGILLLIFVRAFFIFALEKKGNKHKFLKEQWKDSQSHGERQFWRLC